MSKTRVSNLAEKLGIDTKEVLARLKTLGYDVKAGSSTVEDEAIARLTAFKPAESGPEEVRVTTNIVRRRAKPSAADPESAVLDKVEPVTAPVAVIDRSAPITERVSVVKKATEAVVTQVVSTESVSAEVTDFRPAPEADGSPDSEWGFVTRS